MTKYIVNIDDYWKVIVYFDIDYDFWHIIGRDINNISSPIKEEEVYNHITLSAKAFTISNINKHISIVGFNKHTNEIDYINSIIHESEHVKQAMLYAYNVEDSGEVPAYTVAYIAVRLLILHC